MNRPPRQPVTITTAGHVDHGKTALVGALTGHETDRLPEEKRRGMSIEAGFAPLDLPGAPPISIIDVPGHERFVRHMVAAASGVDAFLLCVAADDGVMPQTREHLLVLELLRITPGVVAVTKADRSDPTPIGREVGDLLGADIAVVPVCAPTGDGLEELAAALRDLTQFLSRRPVAGPSRLFVDRAFTLSGIGTVVTGTLWGASLGRGDAMRVEPGGREVRVRRLHVHGSPRERVEAGRVAVNLAAVSPGDVPRGSCLVSVATDAVASTNVLEAEVEWRGAVASPLRSRRRLQMFLGTAEVSARCRLPAASEISSGNRGEVRLQLERSVPADLGDRFVLREGGHTVGGGSVIRRGSKTAKPEPKADSPPPRSGLSAKAAGVLAGAGLSGMTAARIADAIGTTERPAFSALRVLVGGGAVIQVADRYVDAVTLEAAVGAARAQLLNGPANLRDLCELWGVGRERAVPIAEYMDSEGLSERRGNTRIAGPRGFASDS